MFFVYSGNGFQVPTAFTIAFIIVAALGVILWIRKRMGYKD